jgi:iron complex outermembrane receptor protein
MNQQQRSIWIAGVLLMLMACPAWAEVEQENRSQETGTIEAQTAEVAELQETKRETEIPRLSQIEQPATTMNEWLTEIAQAIAQITGVNLNATADGIAIVLETSGELTPTTSVVGNALIVDIPNAVLALPEGNEFQAANPAEGIALVSITPRGDGIRVAITGSEAPPTATVNTEAQNLVLSVTRGTATVEVEEDAIQVVVTGEQEEGYAVDDASTATRTDYTIERYSPIYSSRASASARRSKRHSFGRSH